MKQYEIINNMVFNYSTWLDNDYLEILAKFCEDLKQQIREEYKNGSTNRHP